MLNLSRIAVLHNRLEALPRRLSPSMHAHAIPCFNVGAGPSHVLPYRGAVVRNPLETLPLRRRDGDV